MFISASDPAIQYITANNKSVEKTKSHPGIGTFGMYVELASLVNLSSCIMTPSSRVILIFSRIYRKIGSF